MTDHDAVFAVALHRFAEQRANLGERVTARVAERLALVARAIGVRPEHTAAELGLGSDFTLPHEELLRTFARVIGAGHRDDLRKLWFAIQDLTVAEVEGYYEPQLGAPENSDHGSER